MGRSRTTRRRGEVVMLIVRLGVQVKENEGRNEGTEVDVRDSGMGGPEWD